MKTMNTSKNILDNIGQNKLKMFQTTKVKVGNKNTNNDILEPQAATESILQELFKKLYKSCSWKFRNIYRKHLC